MIGYAMLGTNDLTAAAEFFDAVLVPLAMSRIEDAGTYVGYAPNGSSEITLYLTNPYDEQMASVGNGSLLAFKAISRDAVDQFHQIALGSGARDEGALGERAEGDPTYYAYVRDPDGNKVCVYCAAR